MVLCARLPVFGSLPTDTPKARQRTLPSFKTIFCLLTNSLLLSLIINLVALVASSRQAGPRRPGPRAAALARRVSPGEAGPRVPGSRRVPAGRVPGRDAIQAPGTSGTAP